MLVTGWASTSKRDHALDRVMAGAFDASIRELGLSGPKGIKFLSQHDRHQPIGRIHQLEQRTGGLWMEAEIDESISYAKDLANAIRANNGLSYSIGYRIPEGGVEFIDAGLDSYFKLTRVDLHEVSVVTFPCNDDCVMMFPKSLEDQIADSIAKLKATGGLGSAPAGFEALQKSLDTLLKGSRT